VFQSYALYPHKSVRENLAFGLGVRGVDPRTIGERLAKVAAMLGIDALLDRKPAQLSGGQRQRVALGRAIVREPRAFLLDEPLSNLDPLLRVTMRAELALLHRRLGTTMVYVTHDQEEAMMLGSRMAVMRDGRIEQLGAPLEIFRQPANTFVAGFVGSPAMNVWPCVLSVSGAETRARCPAFSIALDRREAPAPDGAAITLGIRPHDITLTAPEKGDARGRVEVVEPLGTATLIHLRSDDGSSELVRVVVSADTRAEVDGRVGLTLRRDRLHLFDAETGRRLSGSP
jgi:ABC-type sugar transport system ATPase subunit